MSATKIVVNIPGAESFDVRVGAGILDGLGNRVVRSVSLAKTAVLITDTNVGPLYAKDVHKNLKAAGLRVVDITIPAGEISKSLACANEVWEALIAQNTPEDLMIVALGGTTVCNLAGFVAAVYNGGVPLVLVPTSLLSMSSFSASGVAQLNVKDAPDILSVQVIPRYVCASVETLNTIPQDAWERSCTDLEQFAALFAEDFANWLGEHSDDLAARDQNIVAEAIVHSVVLCADAQAEG